MKIKGKNHRYNIVKVPSVNGYLITVTDKNNYKTCLATATDLEQAVLIVNKREYWLMTR